MTSAFYLTKSSTKYIETFASEKLDTNGGELT